MPTLEGGLRIDAEDLEDWELLRFVIMDAKSRVGSDLADQLGALVTQEEVAEDWAEYIVPDLREAFHDEVSHVEAALEAAMHKANHEAGAIWITPEDAFQWYSTLNQARLALEDQFHFGPSDLLEPLHVDPEERDGFLRSKFYCAIQSLLLEYVMK